MCSPFIQRNDVNLSSFVPGTAGNVKNIGFNIIIEQLVRWRGLDSQTPRLSVVDRNQILRGKIYLEIIGIFGDILIVLTADQRGDMKGKYLAMGSCNKINKTEKVFVNRMGLYLSEEAGVLLYVYTAVKENIC